MSTNKTHPLSDEELTAFEATRDIKEELKQALQDLQEGRGRVVYSPLIAVRKSAGVTQQQFAEFLGISVDTLEDWEQQRQHPSKTALMMIAIALSKPEVVRIGFANLDKQTIHSDSEIMGGVPVFTGTRVPLSYLFDYLESGASAETFLDQYPPVPRLSVVSVIKMAGQIVCGYARIIS